MIRSDKEGEKKCNNGSILTFIANKLLMARNLRSMHGQIWVTKCASQSVSHFESILNHLYLCMRIKKLLKNTTNPNNAHLHTKFDSVFVLSDHGIGTIFKKQLEQTISTTIL